MLKVPWYILNFGLPIAVLVGSVFLPPDSQLFRFAVGVLCGSSFMLALFSLQRRVVQPIVLMDVSNLPSPADVRKCPECRAEFEEADVRELPKRPDALAFHCPKCGDRFAVWPKEMC